MYQSISLRLVCGWALCLELDPPMLFKSFPASMLAKAPLEEQINGCGLEGSNGDTPQEVRKEICTYVIFPTDVPYPKVYPRLKDNFGNGQENAIVQFF